MPLPKPNKDAILRSLTSFARRNPATAKNDTGEANGVPYDTDQFMYDRTRPVDQFFFADKDLNHTRANSLASDMQVEVSEISSPRSISSQDEECSEDMKKGITSGSEEMCVGSSHASGVDEPESLLKNLPEVSEQDSSEVGSRVNDNADVSTSDMLPESVEKDSINSSSMPAPKSDSLDSSQSDEVDSHKEHPGDSDSRNTYSSQNSNTRELENEEPQVSVFFSCSYSGVEVMNITNIIELTLQLMYEGRK